MADLLEHFRSLVASHIHAEEATLHRVAIAASAPRVDESRLRRLRVG